MLVYMNTCILNIMPNKTAVLSASHTISSVSTKLVASLHHVLTQKALVNLQYWPFSLYFLVKVLFKTDA